MMGAAARLLLVLTSLAPILVTWAFVDFIAGNAPERQIAAIGVTIALTALCWWILLAAREKLPRYSFKIAAIRPVDSEVVGFVVAYLFPIVFTASDQLDPRVFAFVMILIAVIVWATNAFHFNPLLSLLGFHFYEADSDKGVTSLILTRKDILKTGDISQVAQLSNHVLLDTTGSGNDG